MIPVLPLPAMAIPVAKAPVRTAQVGWAALYARAHAKTSPELIQSWLGVGPEQAQALMSDLVDRKIIHTPVGGVARAIDPMYPSSGIPGARPFQEKIADKARELVKDMLDADDGDLSDAEIEDTEAEEEKIDETP